MIFKKNLMALGLILLVIAGTTYYRSHLPQKLTSMDLTLDGAEPGITFADIQRIWGPCTERDPEGAEVGPLLSLNWGKEKWALVNEKGIVTSLGGPRASYRDGATAFGVGESEARLFSLFGKEPTGQTGLSEFRTSKGYELTLSFRDNSLAEITLNVEDPFG